MLHSPSRFRLRIRAIVNAVTLEPSARERGRQGGNGFSDEKSPPSASQAGCPKARLATHPSLAVVLGRRCDVSSRDLDLCVFGRSLLAPASAPLRPERRRQAPGRSFEPLTRRGHPQRCVDKRETEVCIGTGRAWLIKLPTQPSYA